MISTQKTKKQHYVSQSYLCAWDFSGRHQVYVYDKITDKTRINNIEDIASERFFYDVNPNAILSEKTLIALRENGFTWDSDEKSQGVEHAFAEEIEKPFAEMLKDLILKAEAATPWHIDNCFFISAEKKEAFSAYLAIQQMRIKMVRQTVCDIADCVTQAMEKYGFPAENIAEYAVSKEDARNIHIKMLMDVKGITEIASKFYSLTWMLAINRTSQSFFTTDCPISTYGHIKNPYMSMNGLGSRGVEVFFPISPNIILLMVDGSYHANCLPLERRYIEITEKDHMDFYNSLLALQADRCIYSSTGDFSLLNEMKRANPKVFKPNRVQLMWER